MTSFEAVAAAETLVLDCGAHFGALLHCKPMRDKLRDGTSSSWIVALEAPDAPMGWLWMCRVGDWDVGEMIAMKGEGSFRKSLD
jgi:hypothetical protein